MSSPYFCFGVGLFWVSLNLFWVGFKWFSVGFGADLPILVAAAGANLAPDIDRATGRLAADSRFTRTGGEHPGARPDRGIVQCRVCRWLGCGSSGCTGPGRHQCCGCAVRDSFPVATHGKGRYRSSGRCIRESLRARTIRQLFLITQVEKPHEICWNRTLCRYG